MALFLTGPRAAHLAAADVRRPARRFSPTILAVATLLIGWRSCSWPRSSCSAPQPAPARHCLSQSPRALRFGALGSLTDGLSSPPRMASAWLARRCRRPWTCPTRSCWRASSSRSRSPSTSCSRRSPSGSPATWPCSRRCGCGPARRDLPRSSTSSGCKIFAVAFGMGVVSGIVMSYQFGTNWSRLVDTRRQRPRPAPGLRGADRLLPRGRASWASCCSAGSGSARGCTSSPTCMVALGTLISAFWILSANSWMQTPAGYDDRRTAASCRRTGGRSSSIRPSPTGSRTRCSAPT